MTLGESLAAEGIRLRSLTAGSQQYTTCPRCSHTRSAAGQKKPCLSVHLDHDDGAVWSCQHCGWTGNIPTRTIRMAKEEGGGKGGGRPPPRQRKAAPPPAPPVRPAAHDARAQLRPKQLYEYFGGRGISRETVDAFGVYILAEGFFPGRDPPRAPAIVFPYTLAGVLVNRKYRAPDKHFAQDKGAARTIYNIDAVESDDVMIWVEGEIDVLTLHEAGYPQAVTLPDGTPKQLREEDDPERATDKRYMPLQAHADRLAKVRRHILAGDADTVGRYHVEELARRLGKERCWLATWPEGCKDANETLNAHGPERVAACIEAATPYPIEGVMRLAPGALRAYRQKRHPTYRTGWANLDEILRWPSDGRLIVVVGYTSMGKSEAVDAILMNVMLAYDHKAVIFSPENTPVEMHAEKLAEKWAGQPARAYSPSHIPMDDYQLDEAEAFLADHVTWIVAESLDHDPSLEWVLERARIVIMRTGARWLVIDPWNEIEHKRPGGTTMDDYIGSTLMHLKKFARSHGVNLILVAHPPKMDRDRFSGERPLLGAQDIAGSAKFGDKADIGLTIHQPQPGKPAVIWQVWKCRQRAWGRRGTVWMTWDNITCRYIAREPPEEPAAKPRKAAKGGRLPYDEGEVPSP